MAFTINSYANMTECYIGDRVMAINNDFSGKYSSMKNITYGDTPKCVTNMYRTYFNCWNLTGNPVCGDKVTNMMETYASCNLTGSPVCGDNVTDMSYTYSGCRNLTGSPVCGPNVTNMSSTYSGCRNLTGSPVCGDNVTDMSLTYYDCKNLYGNMYMYSNNVSSMRYCFEGRYNNRRLNIYVINGSTSMNTVLINNIYSIIGSNITWTDDYSTNGVYYNTSINTYIYPVTNVTEIAKENGEYVFTTDQEIEEALIDFTLY